MRRRKRMTRTRGNLPSRHSRFRASIQAATFVAAFLLPAILSWAFAFVGVRMAQGESYEQFVGKFKPKKTTDDCYTPPEVMEVV